MTMKTILIRRTLKYSKYNPKNKAVAECPH